MTDAPELASAARLAALINSARKAGPAVAAAAADWREVVTQLRAFASLEDDWDGDGSPAPEPALIDSAVRLAESLARSGVAPADRVDVGPNATVYLEWHIAPRGYLGDQSLPRSVSSRPRGHPRHCRRVEAA